MPSESGETMIAARYFQHLSRSAMEFLSLSPDADIYQLIAIRLRELLGDAIVAVASYDSRTRVLRQEALEGVGSLLESVTNLAGRPVKGFSSVVNAETEAKNRLGRLVKVEEGLYEGLLRTVPKGVTRTMERLMGIREVYGMGCVAGGECFGCVLFCLRSGAQLPPAEVVEAHVNQAAVAMQRRRAEVALRASEERYLALMERAADSYLVLSTAGIILYANNAVCRVVGYPREELVGRSVSDFIDPSDIANRPLPLGSVQPR